MYYVKIKSVSEYNKVAYILEQYGVSELSMYRPENIFFTLNGDIQGVISSKDTAIIISEHFEEYVVIFSSEHYVIHLESDLPIGFSLVTFEELVDSILLDRMIKEDSNVLRLGEFVFHPKFGKGKIVGYKGSGTAISFPGWNNRIIKTDFLRRSKDENKIIYTY